MDVSELRKQILRALDDARKDHAEQRQAADEAARAYEEFLERIGVPLIRQSAQVLNAAGETFSVHTPAGSARLVSDKAPQTFLELELDRLSRIRVIGRVSVGRGRQGVVVDEQAVGDGKHVADLTESDVAGFLVKMIPKLVLKP